MSNTFCVKFHSQDKIYFCQLDEHQINYIFPKQIFFLKKTYEILSKLPELYLVLHSFLNK